MDKEWHIRAGYVVQDGLYSNVHRALEKDLISRSQICTSKIFGNNGVILDHVFLFVCFSGTNKTTKGE